MIGKNNEKKQEIKPRDDGIELENQFILRLPEEPATALREAIQSGNLKDRMTIKLDNDLRYGEVRLDHWLLYAKVVDLPTIVECLKTIDNKSFYKSSDVCQIMICKEEMDEEPEKESPNKGKKKDPNKVDKKYLWPHGITPPCKNVRKRRFRKTLKKKNVEAPEIEKEVKHLLRIDNEAVKVDYEIINEDLDKLGMLQSDIKDYNEGDEDFNNESLNGSVKPMDDGSIQRRDINVESDDDDDRTASFSQNNTQLSAVAEHDIFGEELSSSDDDEDNEPNSSQPMRELEESSRLSADDSRMSDFFDVSASGSNVTKASEFNKTMFGESANSNMDKFGGSSSNLAAPSGFFDNQSQSSQMQSKRDDMDDDNTNDTSTSTSQSQPQLTSQQLTAKISQLHRQIVELKTQQSQKSQEIASIQNATLKNRMQEALDNVLSLLVEKELELKDYETMLVSQLN